MYCIWPAKDPGLVYEIVVLHHNAIEKNAWNTNCIEMMIWKRNLCWYNYLETNENKRKRSENAWAFYKTSKCYRATTSTQLTLIDNVYGLRLTISVLLQNLSGFLCEADFHTFSGCFQISLRRLQEFSDVFFFDDIERFCRRFQIIFDIFRVVLDVFRRARKFSEMFWMLSDALCTIFRLFKSLLTFFQCFLEVRKLFRTFFARFSRA